MLLQFARDKALGKREGKRQEVKTGDRKCHTYIQLCSSIKPILVHHTERRETKTTEQKRRKKGRWKSEENKEGKIKSTTVRHHVAVERKKEKGEMGRQTTRKRK